MSARPRMDPRLVRSARFWLRAYPPRWRGSQDDGGLALVADLVPDGARRVPVRTAVELTRGGWSYRRRHRPRLGAWLLYRFADLPVTGHDPWVLDDIDGRWYTLRRGYLVWLALGLQGSLSINEEWRASPAWQTWAVAVGITVVFGALMARPSRRYARTKHLGRPDPGPARPAAAR